MIFLENYTKTVLYAYPLLLTVGKDYEEHIKNKALLSYESAQATENLIEYIAEEILCKEKLEWLKKLIEDVLERLSDVERTLISIRYFGKTGRIKYFLRLREKNSADKQFPKWSEREYFRRQQRLQEKVGAMLKAAGLSEEVYERDFAKLDIFEKVDRFIAAGKDRHITDNERRWLRF